LGDTFCDIRSRCQGYWAPTVGIARRLRIEVPGPLTPLRAAIHPMSVVPQLDEGEVFAAILNPGRALLTGRLELDKG
jgi:hypothetical protein